MEERISEPQLIIPTLKLLSIYDNGLSTSNLDNIFSKSCLFLSKSELIPFFKLFSSKFKSYVFFSIENYF